jgi:hypothetical protein
MSRNKVIVYNGDDGYCNLVIPTQECYLSDEEVIAKDVPVQEYSVISHSDLPSFKFRNAWQYNHSNSTVDVDLASAKNICKKELESRYLQIEDQNDKIRKLAAMRGEEPDLLDNPTVPYSLIEESTTLEELESLL